MYYEKHRPRGHRAGKHAVFALLAAALCFALANARTAELVSPALEAGATSSYTRAVSAAAAGVMESDSLGQPVRLSRAGDGTITAVETDAACVNRIRSAVCAAALDSLESGGCVVTVPIGSLTGLPLLSGRGPEIDLRLRPAGACTAELYSTFEAVGINQTRHTIRCVIKTRMYAMLPGRGVPLELSADVLLAESVIVGRVPESYTYVIGDQSDTVSRIFDYADTGK